MIEDIEPERGLKIMKAQEIRGETRVFPPVEMGLSFTFEDTPGPGQYRLPGSVAQKDSCPVARRGASQLV